MVNEVYSKSLVRTRQYRASKKQPVHWRGLVLAEQGDWEAALQCAHQTLAQCPDHLGALEVLCRAQLRMNDCERALLTVRKLVRLNPHEPGYEVLRASALQSCGRFSEALESLQSAKQRSRNVGFKARVEREIATLVQCLGLTTETSGVIGAANSRPLHPSGAIMLVN